MKMMEAQVPLGLIHCAMVVDGCDASLLEPYLPNNEANEKMLMFQKWMVFVVVVLG